MSNVDELLDVVRQTGLDVFRQEVNKYPETKSTLLRELSQHPDTFRTFSHNFKLLKQMRAAVSGIDPEGIADRETALKSANQVSDEQLTRRKEIMADPVWLSHNHPQHESRHKEFLATFQPELNGDEI